MKITLPLAGVATVLLAAACKPESKPETGGKPETPAPAAPAADAPAAAPDPQKTESYVGLAEKAAGEMADKAGLKWRIIEVDGEPRPATMDYREDRLNFAIKDGKVIRVTKG